MKNIVLYLSFIFLIFLSSCKKDDSSLSEKDAAGAINSYLVSNPIYETTRFDFGEVKIKSGKNDQEKVKIYKELETDGMIHFELQKQKKKFLSKDSSFIYIVRLTDNASPFVLKKDDKKATVKILEYKLDESKVVHFEKLSNNSAKVTVSLKKMDTGFTVLASNKSAFSSFLTKSYKLKFRKDLGWEVVSSL